MDEGVSIRGIACSSSTCPPAMGGAASTSGARCSLSLCRLAFDAATCTCTGSASLSQPGLTKARCCSTSPHAEQMKVPRSKPGSVLPHRAQQGRVHRDPGDSLVNLVSREINWTQWNCPKKDSILRQSRELWRGGMRCGNLDFRTLVQTRITIKGWGLSRIHETHPSCVRTIRSRDYKQPARPGNRTSSSRSLR